MSETKLFKPAHTVTRDKALDDDHRAFEVGARPHVHAAEFEFDGGTAREQGDDALVHSVVGTEVIFALEDLHDAARIALAGADADEPHALGIEGERRHGMARLVEGDLFLFGNGALVDRFFRLEDEAEHGAHDVFAADLALSLEARVDARLVEHALECGAGVAVHETGDALGVHIGGDLLVLKIMAHDGDGLAAVGRADLEDAVEPPRTAQRTGKLAKLVGGGDDKDVRPLHVIDARLHGDEFLGVAGIAVRGELIEIVEEDDGGRVFLRVLKGLGDVFHELIVCLDLAEDIALSLFAHFLDEGGRHQRLADARHPVQQNAVRKFDPERSVLFGVLRHIADLEKFFFSFFVADDFFKCVHINTSLLFYTVSITHPMSVFWDTAPEIRLFSSLFAADNVLLCAEIPPIKCLVLRHVPAGSDEDDLPAQFFRQSERFRRPAVRLPLHADNKGRMLHHVSVAPTVRGDRKVIGDKVHTVAAGKDRMILRLPVFRPACGL